MVRDPATVAAAPRAQAPEWVVLLLVCLGQFMVILDVSIVNVALPSIRSDLGFSTTSLQWVVNAYTLVFAGFLLLGGRAADLFGRRRLFLIGVTMFALASLAGGLAQNQYELVAARALQGLGGAVLAPATLTIILATYTEPAARAKALGAWAAVAGAGGASGALLGGIITDALSWRWIFFVNVPVGVLVFLGARLAINETRGTQAHRHLDVLGSITATAGLVAITWGFVRSNTVGWSSFEVLGSFLVGAALLAWFVLIEAQAPAPLLPLRLFRSRAVTASNVVMIGITAAIFPMWYFLTLYFQNVRGDSPLVAGIAFLPLTFAVIVSAQLASRLIPRIGARPLLAGGPLLSAVGLVWLAQLSVDAALIWVLIPGAAVTFGLGLTFPAVTMAASAGVAPAEAGLVSGVVNTTRQVGASLGLAVLTTLAASHTAGLVGPGVSAGAALTKGFGFALAIAACIAAAAALVGLVVPSRTRPRVPARVVETSELGAQADAA